MELTREGSTLASTCCCRGAAEGGCRKFWWLPKPEVPESGVENGGNDQPGPPPTAPVVGPFAGAPATCTNIRLIFKMQSYSPKCANEDMILAGMKVLCVGNLGAQGAVVGGRRGKGSPGPEVWPGQAGGPGRWGTVGCRPPPPCWSRGPGRPQSRPPASSRPPFHLTWPPAAASTAPAKTISSQNQANYQNVIFLFITVCLAKGRDPSDGDS